jgi:hypothetical protein
MGVPQVRWSALTALALPVLAGIGYMSAAGAPRTFLAVNALALGAGIVWASFGRAPSDAIHRRILAIALLALFALPLLTGPSLDGVARWIPAGPVTLHAGLLAVPALALLAANDRAYGPALLLAAGAVGLLQPDAASVLAVAGAAVAIALTARDRRFGLVAVVATVAAVIAFRRPDLPAQPFVEHVIADAAGEAVIAAIGLSFALLVSALLVGLFTHRDRSVRAALAATLLGFAGASLIGSYPTPLVGYGASAILGFALALGLRRKPAS